MKPEYAGREQTLAKHFILEKYLQSLAFKLLLGGYPTLTYVDGFSGPWESRTDDYSDTSFMIAIRVLKDAQAQLRAQGKSKPASRGKSVECFRPPHEELHALSSTLVFSRALRVWAASHLAGAAQRGRRD